MSPTLRSLQKFLDRACSIKALRLIQKIAAMDEPGVIDVLAAQLDIPGVIGDAAAKALIAMGPRVRPAMLACLESEDSDMNARAVRVLYAVRRQRAQAA